MRVRHQGWFQDEDADSVRGGGAKGWNVDQKNPRMSLVRFDEVCPLLRAALASTIKMHRRGLLHPRFLAVAMGNNLRFVSFRVGPERVVRLGLFRCTRVAQLALVAAVLDPSLRSARRVRTWLECTAHDEWVRTYAPQAAASVARVHWNLVRRQVVLRRMALFWQEYAIKRAYDPKGGKRFKALVMEWEAMVACTQ